MAVPLPAAAGTRNSPRLPKINCHPSPPSLPGSISAAANRVVAFTTPQNYAPRLSHLLRLHGWQPLWCPTVLVQTTPHTEASIRLHLSYPSGDQATPPLDRFAAIAFTSRSGISAFSEALATLDNPPLAPAGEAFTIAALGKDAELLDEALVGGLCHNSDRIKVLIPPISTPAGLAESLGAGLGRSVLCPVPLVVGLEEPPVVPDFLRELTGKGWIPVRAEAYETRWAGAESAEPIVRRSEYGGGLNAVVFSSTGEVEGLLKSLKEKGLDWETVKRRCPELVVAAHGPVTAAGAERLGVGVDVVSRRFDSFAGVVEALALRWESESESKSPPGG
ncbi:uncharacterized protein LOC127800081 [Diospyros lotus]|uniref:uncharacterized protein LOC127800081 n=1 Tax=Diospyros lotus TaxID=55363 RepID=UPI002250878C|nr:uncharacterized protein LOC127800081 [Diospyros lotus]XP_052190460.1 uncharacterized protein LOC127800081 [Diospyros lotus]